MSGFPVALQMTVQKLFVAFRVSFDSTYQAKSTGIHQATSKGRGLSANGILSHAFSLLDTSFVRPQQRVAYLATICGMTASMRLVAIKVGKVGTRNIGRCCSFPSTHALNRFESVSANDGIGEISKNKYHDRQVINC